MAKSVKRILVLAVIFTMTIVNYGLPLQAIAAEGGSIFNFSFFRRNEIALEAYFGEDTEKTEEIKNVNDTAMITLEVSPLIEGYLKSGSLKFNLKNGNENNFKLVSATMEEKEELELDDVDTQMLEETKNEEEKVVEDVVSEGTEPPKEDVKEEVNEIKEEVVEPEEEPNADSEKGKNSLMDILKGSGMDEIVNEVANKAPKAADKEPENAETEKIEEEPETNKEEDDVQDLASGALEEIEEIDIMEQARTCYEVNLASENEIALKNIIDSTKIFVEVSYNQTEKINVEDLFSEIEIVLEGNYINKKLETLDIIRSQDVILGWEYSKEVEITSDITKVSPFTVGKNAGTIVENIVTVKREVEEDKFLPIKQTNIKIEIPKINDKLPIAVNVAANKLMATLGKELTGKEFTKNNWNYDEESGLLEIQVVNSEMLLGNGEDKFDIICRYEDYFEEEVINLDKKVFVQVEEFSANENVIQELEIVETQEKEVVAGELMSYAIMENEETIGKGKINANYHTETGDTRFSSRLNVTVLTSDILDEVLIEPVKEIYKNKDDVEFDATPDVKYTGVKFNLAEIKDMLVQGTTMDLLDGDGNVFHTITNEVDATKIEFASQIDNLKVRINDVKVNGNLSIEFVKVINRSQYSQAEFAGFEKIENSYKAEVKYVGFEDTFQLSEVKDEIKLDDSITNVNFTMNRTHLSAINENLGVEFKINLLNNLETSDIFKNPYFEIVLPVHIKDVTINDLYMLYENGLNVKEYRVEKENEINKIIIELEGTQAGFNFSNITNGTDIILNVDIDIDEITPQKRDEIKLYYCNEAATKYQSQSNWNIGKDIPDGIIKTTNGYDSLTFEYQAPSGLIAVNSISNYDDSGETIRSIKQGEMIKTLAIKGDSQVATMELTVLNNTVNECVDTVLLGRIPFKGNTDVETGEDLGTNVDTILKTEVIPNAYNSNTATIYYSSNPTADRDLNNELNQWRTNASNLDEIKSFMIVVDGPISHGGILKYTYDFEIPANLGHEVGISGSFGAFYNERNENLVTYKSIVADRVGLITESGLKYEVSMDVDIGNGTDVGEARYITYVVKVANTGSEDLRNVKIVVPRPTYAMICEETEVKGTGNLGYEITVASEKVFEIEEIKAGETVQREVYVKTNNKPDTFEDYCATLPNVEKLDTGEIISRNENGETVIIEKMPDEFFVETYAMVYIDEMAKENKTNSVKNKLVDSIFDIVVDSFTEHAEQLNAGGDFGYTVSVQNISNEDLEDVVIECKLPEEVEFKELRVISKEFNHEYDKDSHTVFVYLDNLNSKVSERIYLDCNVANMKNVGARNILFKVSVKTDKYQENASPKVDKVIGAELSIAQETNLINNDVLECDEFEVVLNLANNGDGMTRKVNVEVDIPEDLEIVKVTSDGDKQFTVEKEQNLVKARLASLGPKKEISLIIVVKSKPLAVGEEVKNITIPATANEEWIGDLNVNSVEVSILDNPDRALTEAERKEEEEKVTIKNPEKTEMTNKKEEQTTNKEEKPAQKPTQNQPNTNVSTNNKLEASQTGKTFKISGQVWKDQNKNNIKDNEEKGLKDIKVYLYKGNSRVKYSVTDSLGKYRFSSIPEGSYTIVFEYDGEMYYAAKYKDVNVQEDKNSDVIEAEAGMAISDIVNSSTEDVVIDLGLQDRDEFNLEIHKYITKAIVTTKGKEKVEEYDNADIAKLEIRSKELKNTTIELEYKIVVTNTGDVSGTANLIKDYLPDELTFNSKKNSGWQVGKDGVLYNETLKDDVIKPGESREIKLIVNKVMTENNVGTISNKVELAETYSQNNVELNKEDNIITQEMIVTISTGRTISIVLMVTLMIMASVFIYGVKTGKIKRSYK